MTADSSLSRPLAQLAVELKGPQLESPQAAEPGAAEASLTTGYIISDERKQHVELEHFHLFLYELRTYFDPTRGELQRNTADSHQGATPRFSFPWGALMSASFTVIGCHVMNPNPSTCCFFPG